MTESEYNCIVDPILSSDGNTKLLGMAIYGILVKIYDDLDELYMIKNQRILSCLRTLQVIVLFYWVCVLATNKYDILIILWLLLICTFDWEAFSTDPFFFSIIAVFVPLCMITFLYHDYYVRPTEYVLFFMMILCLSTPYPDFLFLTKYNGLYHRFTTFVRETFFMNDNHINNIPPSFQKNLRAIGIELHSFYSLPTPSNTLNQRNTKKHDVLINLDMTVTELEVSNKKIKLRTCSMINLLICLFVIFLLKRRFTNKTSKWYQMLNACSYLTVGNISYIFVSILNQINVLYFHPEVVEMHNMKNDIQGRFVA